MNQLIPTQEDSEELPLPTPIPGSLFGLATPTPKYHQAVFAAQAAVREVETRVQILDKRGEELFKVSAAEDILRVAGKAFHAAGLSWTKVGSTIGEPDQQSRKRKLLVGFQVCHAESGEGLIYIYPWILEGSNDGQAAAQTRVTRQFLKGFLNIIEAEETQEEHGTSGAELAAQILQQPQTPPTHIHGAPSHMAVAAPSVRVGNFPLGPVALNPAPLSPGSVPHDRHPLSPPQTNGPAVSVLEKPAPTVAVVIPNGDESQIEGDEWIELLTSLGWSESLAEDLALQVRDKPIRQGVVDSINAVILKIWTAPWAEPTSAWKAVGFTPNAAKDLPENKRPRPTGLQALRFAKRVNVTEGRVEL